jgi:hypothetical protein
VHRDLGDGETEAVRTGQHLDIEGEAVDGDEVEHQAGYLGAESLEPTLGVEKVELGARGHQPVEQAAHQQPDHVPALHHRVGERPGADGSLVRLQLLEEQRDGSRVDGHVCVHVRDGCTAGRSDASPDGSALALVGSQPDDAVVGKVGGQGSGPSRGVVVAAVVYHDDLGVVEIDGAGADGDPEPFKGIM